MTINSLTPEYPLLFSIAGLLHIVKFAGIIKADEK